MSEKDDIFPGLPTGGSDFDTREAEERADVASLERELAEQERIAANTGGVFDKNRVPQPAEGRDGRFVINRDHWGE